MAEPVINIGVDVGGTNIKAGVVDGDGRILAQVRMPTNAKGGAEAVIASVVRATHEVLARSDVPLAAVHSIGVGVPGTADSTAGIVLYAPNLFWRNIDIGTVIRQQFGRPVWVAQDTRAATWAEFLAGAGVGKAAIAGVTLGTGVGCGLVFDGKIFHGALNTAGEFGHQLVELDGHSCNCGRRGCLEAHAGGLAIVRDAAQYLPQLQQQADAEHRGITVDDVYTLALRGHAAARVLTNKVVRYVGIGLVNLINLTSVEVVSLSGGISNAPSSLLLDPLTAFVRANVYETIAEKVMICRSALGDDAPMIGAALLYKAFPSPTKARGLDPGTATA